MTWLGAKLGLPEPPHLGEFVARARVASRGDVIAFPGLVNSHDHLEFNCYPPTGRPPYRDFLEWSRDVQADRALLDGIGAIPIAIRQQLGLLKNVLWGVTAVADHGGKGESGIINVIPQPHALHSPELARSAHLRLAMGLGTAVLHLAEGVTAESRARANALLRWNILRRRIAGVHAVSMTGNDFDQLDALIWCPGSNFFLFDQTADVRAAAQHCHILFGTDSTLSAPATLWDHLRRVRGIISDPKLAAALTTGPTAFWGLRRNAGDFVVARRRCGDDWDAFFAIAPADILLVMHQKRVALFDAALAGATSFGTDFFPIDWGEVRKYVRMPMQHILRELNHTAPAYDCASLIGRFAGVSASVCRAA